MAIGWFITRYRQKPGGPFGRPIRYCAMDDFTSQISADGGAWAESEVLGGYAVVKVRASEATLSDIAKDDDFRRVPVDRLDDPLSSLNTNQKNVLKNIILAMGYTEAEIAAALSNDLRDRTLGQVLRFIAQRRLKPRWDNVQGQIVLDGVLQDCRPIADVDAEIAGD